MLRYLKFAVGFISMVLLVWAGYAGWKIYQLKQGEKVLDALVQQMDQQRQDDLARAMADTYGSSTPQGTLQMYISAVEKGDYELASKYFIEEKQDAELKSLQGSKKENIDNVINLLRQDLTATGSYSEDEKNFGVRKPLFVDFIKYPNNIWKIVEI